MSNSIKATSILKGKDAQRFLEELSTVNKKYLGDPEYRSAVEVKLEECEELYINFMSKMR